MVFHCRRAEGRDRKIQEPNSGSAGGGSSGRTAVVVVQQAAEPLAAFDLARGSAGLGAQSEQPIVQPLVISLGMVVLQPLADRVSQRLLAEEDHAVDALGFEGPEEALQMRVQVRRPRRQKHALGSSLFNELAKLIGELAVAVHQQVLLAVQKPSSQAVSSRARKQLTK